MSVLLIAEHNNKEVRPFTLNAITAASQMDTDVHVLLIGKIVEMLLNHYLKCQLLKKYYMLKLLIMKTI